jgi:hypothetical protein
VMRHALDPMFQPKLIPLRQFSVQPFFLEH